MPSGFIDFEEQLKVDDVDQDFRGVVTKVIDGDTFWIQHPDIDEPFKIRIRGINAPEKNAEGGPESAKWLKAEIEGDEVDVIVDTNDLRGKYGRLLGQIFHIGEDIALKALWLGKAVEYGQKGFLVPIESQLSNKLYKNIWGTNF